MRYLTLLSFLGLAGLPLVSQAEVVETNVVIQFKMHIQHAEEESSAHTQQKSSTYAFKTSDLIQNLVRDTDQPFTSRARLVHRYETESAYYVVEKGLDDYDVTEFIFPEFYPHISSDLRPYIIDKKIAKKTELGTHKHFGLGILSLATRGQGTNLDMTGPLSESTRLVRSKENLAAVTALITYHLVGLGGFDFRSDGAENIGLAQGVFKTAGHKILSKPKVIPITGGAGLGSPYYGWPWFGGGSSSDIHLLPALP